MSDHAKRRDRLRRLIRKAGADALLVTNFTNVTYLTGFTGDDSYLLVTPNEAILMSDSRYTTQIEEECPDVEMAIRGTGVSMVDWIRKFARQAKIRRLGFESSSMSVREHAATAKHLEALELVPMDGSIEQLRMIKDKSEVDRIRVATRQARRAFEVIRASLTPDMTEKEVAANLEHQGRKFGAKCFSFPAIIAVGSRAALPHATPTDRRIGESDFVLFDWGMNEGLYVSDLTRMVVVAVPPGGMGSRNQSGSAFMLKTTSSSVTSNIKAANTEGSPGFCALTSTSYQPG